MSPSLARTRKAQHQAQGHQGVLSVASNRHALDAKVGGKILVRHPMHVAADYGLLLLRQGRNQRLDQRLEFWVGRRRLEVSAALLLLYAPVAVVDSWPSQLPRVMA